MTTLQKIFQYQSAELEFWQQANAVLGFTDVQECWEWPIKDCTIDSFDNTLELICEPKFAGLTKEQVSAFLNMGFEWVFERIGQAGRAFSRDHETTYNLEESDRDKRLIQKYRNEIQRLKQELSAKG